MTPTKEQREAIDARDNQILVAAAAGSGKTAVLVQRILKLVAEENVPIDRLLVVTFTEAAASEMKERIGDALTKLLESRPDDENLLRQSARLSTAPISTIHSFCMRLVKDNFQRIELDPSFRVGDQTELRLLQSQVMDNLFEESYSSNENFAALVEAFGGGKTRDVRLDELIRRLYDFIESRPFPEEAASAYKSIGMDVWFGIIKEEIALELDTALSVIQRACKLCRLPGGPEKYLLTLYDDESQVKGLRNILGTASLEKLYEAIKSISHSKIYVYRGKEKETVNEDLRLEVKELRDKNIKKRLERLQTRFMFASPEKMLADIQNVQPVVESLLDLCLEYRARYSAEKRVRNLVDFSDLEHFAIQLLWEEGSPVAKALSSKFEEVLIDEYQDTNEVQEMILSAIKPKRRFMVGDVKQSIYGFRHAKPQLFIEKQDSDATRRIVLSKNFRSRIQVLDAVNFFFERLMSRAVGDVDYDDDARLNLGASYSDEGDFKAELHIIGDGNEGLLIARRIHELVLQGFRYGDIVVLTRSLRSAAIELTEELKQQGIHAVAEMPGGLFDTPEVKTALSLLRVVDNPRQDIDLLAVLRLYGFSADELLRLRHGAGDGDYYDCLLAYDEEDELHSRVAEFLSDIARWRKRAVVLSISRLIGVLYEETGLPYVYGEMRGGAVRQANLQLLLEKAIQYESTSFSGLFHFVRYIEWLKEHSSDEENAAMLLPEDDSIVQVMTIHKSKGLEFPVVILSGLGRRFNRMDERVGVVLHPQHGLGAMYTDLEKRTRANTIPRLALSLLRQKENMSEEMRVLYVAMTRAKEKLIMTGCAAEVPTKPIREANTFLEWLAPCVTASQEYVSLCIHPSVEASEGEAVSVKEPAPRKAAPKAIQPIFELPSKLAISELKRLYALETSPDSAAAFDDENTFEAPKFYTSGQITPMRMGTMLHTAVEHMDIHRDRDPAAISALIQNLAEKGLLSREEAGAIDIARLCAFANSPLADRMRAAKSLHREVPFVIGIRPEEIYDTEADTNILVHGIIDCYFETADGEIVLVDFKSDARPETLQKRYATQMKVYRRAIEKATGKPLSESLFYSL